MINYDKIVDILQLWKASCKTVHEHRCFSIEPHTHHAGTYFVQVIIKVFNLTDFKKEFIDRSQKMTITNLQRDNKDISAQIHLLHTFLIAFEQNFALKLTAFLAAP